MLNFKANHMTNSRTPTQIGAGAIVLFLFLASTNLFAWWIFHQALPNTSETTTFDLRTVQQIAFVPIGMLAAAILSWGIEIAVIGWPSSGLAQILYRRTASTKVDLFYFALALSGLKPVFALVLSLGGTLALKNWCDSHLQIKVLEGQALWLQYPIVFLVNTFLFYCVHRIMHSKIFWPIHKIHHAAQEMNLLTPHRNHPIDTAVVLLVTTAPAAILGADPSVLLVYTIFNGLYQSLVHSNIALGSDWLDAIFITPEAHRAHHSNDPKHFDTNYGIISLWDMIFGTYQKPIRGEVYQIGFRQKGLHNSASPWIEFFRVIWTWPGEIVQTFEHKVAAPEEIPEAQTDGKKTISA